MCERMIFNALNKLNNAWSVLLLLVFCRWGWRHHHVFLIHLCFLFWFVVSTDIFGEVLTLIYFQLLFLKALKSCLKLEGSLWLPRLDWLSLRLEEWKELSFLLYKRIEMLICKNGTYWIQMDVWIAHLPNHLLQGCDHQLHRLFASQSCIYLCINQLIEVVWVDSSNNVN